MWFSHHSPSGCHSLVGISPFLAKSFNNNMLVSRSFTWFFNFNSITSHLLVIVHGLSTAIKQEQFGSFVHHHHHHKAFSSPTCVSKSFLMLTLPFINTTSNFLWISLFPSTSTYTPSYLRNIQWTCIWFLSHQVCPSSCSEALHKQCFQTHACVQCMASYRSTFLSGVMECKVLAGHWFKI